MNSSLAATINGTVNIYKKCFVTAFKITVTSWPLIIGSLGLCFITAAIYTAFSTLQLGLLTGFLVGLYQLCMLSLIYEWLSDATRMSKITFRNILTFNGDLFFKIMGVGFILWLLEILLQSVFTGQSGTFALQVVGFLIGILLNPIPEVIYLHRFDGMHAISHAFNFVKENWVEWFVPVILFVAVCRLMVPLSWLDSIVNVTPFLPVVAMLSPFLAFGFLGIMSGSLGVIMFGLLGIVLGVYFMIFRGLLFLELDSSSRRKRAYQQ